MYPDTWILGLFSFIIKLKRRLASRLDFITVAEIFIFCPIMMHFYLLYQRKTFPQAHALMEVEETHAAQAPSNVGKGKEIATPMLTVLAI